MGQLGGILSSVANLYNFRGTGDEVDDIQQMLPCPKCGSQNAVGYQFCGACGQKLQYSCPYCGAMLDPTSRFCPNCGAQQNWPAQQQAQPQTTVGRRIYQEHQGTDRAVTENTRYRGGCEYKHAECNQGAISAVIQQHQLFYWDVVGTQTIVSKEAHFERGGIFFDDKIYSVVTEERFATIDFGRRKNIPNYDQIKAVDREYFQICWELAKLGCSSVDNYRTPPQKSANGCLLVLTYGFLIIPGILYSLYIRKKNEQLQISHRALLNDLDQLLAQNKHLLNV